MSIVIGIPYYESIHLPVLAAVKALVDGGHVTHVFKRQGPRLECNRNALIDDAVKAGAEFLLSVDSDVAAVDPARALNALVTVMRDSHDAAVVSGAYEIRGEGGKCWCAAIMDEASRTERYVTKEESSSLMRVSFCGMGFALLRLSAVQRLQREYFYNSVQTADDGRRVPISEDVTFCRRITEELHSSIYLQPSFRLDHLKRIETVPGAQKKRDPKALDSINKIALEGHRALMRSQLALDTLAKIAGGPDGVR